MRKKKVDKGYYIFGNDEGYVFLGFKHLGKDIVVELTSDGDKTNHDFSKLTPLMFLGETLPDGY